MPYSVKKQGSKYCVYKKENGEKVGCTDGNKEALRKCLYQDQLLIRQGGVKFSDNKIDKYLDNPEKELSLKV